MLNKPPLLNKLLWNLSTVEIPAIEIAGITQDSRTVKPGYLFCAHRGTYSDGRQFIQDAISKGAAAVAMEIEDTEMLHRFSIEYAIPVIPVLNLGMHLSEIAGRFYDHPSKRMKIFGITGTNGKTSISYFLCEAGQKLGFKSALVGTLGYGLPPALIQTGFTTPDAIELQRILAELRDKGINWVAMEVSSHGLDQGRVNAIRFDTAIFTNLTRDHLDYHQTMEAYGRAKAKLFQLEGLKTAIINADDDFGWELLQTLPHTLALYGFSALAKHRTTHIPIMHAQHANLDLNGITASLSSPWGSALLHSPMMGRFYLSNLLAVFSVLCANGFAFEQILNLISNLSPVPGRMEAFGGTHHQPRVLVDFSHTPDSLKQALVAIREHGVEKIWCVFGCGGDRDAGKRPLMGEIAERYADEVIITNDNPRTEDPLHIATEIRNGLNHPERAVIELDRQRAILHAIESASEEDVVLIAGKGHENYQIIGTEKKPFSDAVTVQMILAEREA